MEKSIEQLLELSKNPYFTMSNDERKRLDDFLSKRSEQQSQQPKTGDDSERNIPATVLNKNKVKKETGEIPTVDNNPKKETGQLEEPEYEEISKDLAEKPAHTSTTESA